MLTGVFQGNIPGASWARNRLVNMRDGLLLVREGRELVFGGEKGGVGT